MYEFKPGSKKIGKKERSPGFATLRTAWPHPQTLPLTTDPIKPGKVYFEGSQHHIELTEVRRRSVRRIEGVYTSVVQGQGADFLPAEIYYIAKRGDNRGQREEKQKKKSS